MRVRKIKDIMDKIEKRESPYFLQDETSYKGRWSDYFGNENPIYIEIGSGKGGFITQIANNNEEINFLGIEKTPEIFHKMILKAEAIEKRKNLGLLLLDGIELSDVFKEKEVSRIFLNFSDPWPKKRHSKKRLTSQAFLNIYSKILKDEGEIHFKTDNQQLFEYSLVSLSENNWILKRVYLNYHPTEDILDEQTEYENKFRKKNQIIYRLEASKRRF